MESEDPCPGSPGPPGPLRAPRGAAPRLTFLARSISGRTPLAMRNLLVLRYPSSRRSTTSCWITSRQSVQLCRVWAFAVHCSTSNWATASGCRMSWGARSSLSSRCCIRNFRSLSSQLAFSRTASASRDDSIFCSTTSSPISSRFRAPNRTWAVAVGGTTASRHALPVLRTH